MGRNGTIQRVVIRMYNPAIWTLPHFRLVSSLPATSGEVRITLYDAKEAPRTGSSPLLSLVWDVSGAVA